MARRDARRDGSRRARPDRRSRALEIEFSSGRAMRFAAMDEEVARRFLASSSPMSFFRNEIEEEYEGTEFEPGKEEKEGKASREDAEKLWNSLFK